MNKTDETDRELQILRNIFYKPQLIVEYKLGEYLFEDEVNEKIFLDIMKRFNSSKPISFDDFLSMKSYPDYKKRRLEEVRIIDYRENTHALQTNIQEEKVRSKLMEHLEHEITNVNCGESIRGVINNILKKCNEINSYLSNSSTYSMEDVVSKWLNQKRELTRFPFESLSFVATEGFEFVGIGAPPSTGKTLFANELMYAYPKDKNILFISLEMKAEQIISRRISSMTGISANKIRFGLNGKDSEVLWTPDEVEKIKKSAEKISKCENIKIIDDIFNIEDIVGVIKKENYKKKLDFVFIDQFHQINMTDGDSEVAKKENCSRTLKQLAKSEEIVICVILQPNRNLVMREDKRMTMNDIRGASALEQDLDLIITLYRDSLYNKQAKKDIIEVIIEKNKNGDIGNVPMGVDLSTQRIYDLKKKNIIEDLY
ncbi:MAG: DnaB helicase C-terminal domain-containing protein [Novosphingobium sp.]|nr:DnaB helicase C-terminal domain-containing protein [Novosphingobium sp.]